jgi:hypothetical protein
MPRRFAMLAIAALIGAVALAPAAGACGFLVAPNGAVRLVRTSTLVAWDGEVERYITNFEFSSPETSFGSIIPLPAQPTHVGRAGDWTLQRLAQEVAPPTTAADEAGSDAASATEDTVTVVLQTRVDSLDITVVRGGGTEVAAWATDNGFAFREDAGPLLDFYSDRSPYFLAAKFDAAAAESDGLTSGDGIPILVEMPTERPWVPLHILAFDKPAGEVVVADVFLLTPDRPELVHGRGLTVGRSEQASDLLLDDLRSDDQMAWIPRDAWFSHLELVVPAGDLDYDLSVGAAGTPPSLLEAGLTRFDLSASDLEGFGFTAGDADPDDAAPWWVVGGAAFLAAIAGGLVSAAAVTRRAGRARPTA